MNYKDLKHLVQYLKEMVKCAECKKRFTDNEISILATLPIEGVFQLDCNKCGHSMLVNVGMKGFDENKKAISKDDILDMHSFLNKFNGDFKSLFKPSKK
jgi:hypothetical protein